MLLAGSTGPKRQTTCNRSQEPSGRGRWWKCTIKVGARKRRRLGPLGLVLKSGAWYLVGAVGDQVCTYRIAGISDPAVQSEVFERPLDFDLAAYWLRSTQRLESQLHQGKAILRLPAHGLKMLEPFTTPYVRAGMEIGELDQEDMHAARRCGLAQKPR